VYINLCFNVLVNCWSTRGKHTDQGGSVVRALVGVFTGDLVSVIIRICKAIFAYY
jgi:hypothetical protein